MHIFLEISLEWDLFESAYAGLLSNVIIRGWGKIGNVGCGARAIKNQIIAAHLRFRACFVGREKHTQPGMGREQHWILVPHGNRLWACFRWLFPDC